MIYIRGTWYHKLDGLDCCMLDDIVTSKPTDYPVLNFCSTSVLPDYATQVPLYAYDSFHKGSTIKRLYLRRYCPYILTLLEEYINVTDTLCFEVSLSAPLTTDVLYLMPRIISSVQQIGVLNRSTGMYDYVSDPFELHEMILNMG